MNTMALLEEDITLPGDVSNGAFLLHHGTVPPLDNPFFDFICHYIY